MNNTVRATGMEVTTTVGDSLLIALSDTTDNNVAAANEFGTGIHQVITGALQPSSTINASDSGASESGFFYSYDAKADGSRASDITEVNYSPVLNNTITVDATNYSAYKDYVFELKAMNAQSTDQYLNLTRLNLLYNGDVTDVTKAFRVAVFTQEESTAATNYVTRPTAAGKIFTINGAQYFEDATNHDDGVATVSTRSDVLNLVKTGGAGWSQTIDAGQTKYYKVTVRLWLEGEDTDCYSTKFIDLKDKWSLDLEFKLEPSATQSADPAADGATLFINSQARATVSGTAPAFTVALSNLTGDTAVSYAWYKVGTTTDTSVGTSAASFTAAEDGDYYCIVTTARGTQYRSNVVNYTTTP